jgi:hypothetical protein
MCLSESTSKASFAFSLPKPKYVEEIKNQFTEGGVEKK